MSSNQNPEQAARDRIDAMVEESGWKVQTKNQINFNAGPGIAVREYPTDTGPADYVLFVNQQASGVNPADEPAGVLLARIRAEREAQPVNRRARR